MSSDGGSLLLREPDKRYKVTKTITSCRTDYSCPDRITHELLLNILSLLVIALIMLPVSLFAFRYSVRRAKKDGSLTQD